MRKSIKNNDFKTPFKFPRSNVADKKEQASQETLSYKSVKYSVTYPAKRAKIDISNKDKNISNVEDSNNEKLPHKKLKVLKERNTNDVSPENSNKFNYVRPTFSFSQSLKKFSPVKPAHDPKAQNAIILYDPLDDLDNLQENIKGKDKSVAEILGTKNPDNMKIPVIVDPILGQKLRPHQIDGVKFLYNCTTGRTVEGVYGCIMADEMGLGKTLQCITLLWTLLKQSPEFNKKTIEKCIIVCPSSLVTNWANELVKWLGTLRIKPLVIDNKGGKENVLKELRQFAISQGRTIIYPVLIVSYETLRTNIAELKDSKIGLLLCDEGHRLKNSNSLTFQALNSLQVQRRVILSGTPIQNDLSEYFSLLNFANPGLLGTPNEFRRNYENPILRGRDADATEHERSISDQKLAELWSVVSKFIIRRSNDILSKYLPIKYEHVVFCRLSEFQLSLYELFMTSPEIQHLLRGIGSQPLKAITILKKLCNHPDLLDLPKDLKRSEKCFPQGYSIKEKARIVRPEFSGKMLVLDRMLAKIKNETNDKIVLISNYTQTLDLFEKLCRMKKYECLRLDGSMSIKKRQELVNQFNNPNNPEFVFLLSSKAGGCGINLIGANRLVLFDPDWNPASDQQALARIWRDGQKKQCFIYRFIATGTIEEKIFQRQSHKQSLSSCVVDEEEGVERHFSLESLRRLFQFDPDTICDTHSTFKCKRCIEGVQVLPRLPSEKMVYGDTSSWDHFTGGSDLLKIKDSILKLEVNQGVVSYVFQYTSH
ncbi:putative dna repair and recombination protein rad54 protein [Rhizophagus irregularis DAOM 181602=DAOM 197198]|uniref:Dna repair and recombination protein rad54 protein n=1 Tax=Rhizophagus irregularis (strain DAOM 181602 / DAOM 197198 / MUCL 43194) TaxID=747089 RepID=A0A2P4QRV0_RHIID|nr:putative dna repair and recombination protein rad54 protein [Rhizophagus irregularis DAOM 181602=DAOM 197198]POG80389.1 putative dna repair and recombination protein rad54 protein [Rhizophagus irregularis DAOM 181602=DAOM 197198]|eukprot:XP_025187255.1 putative dna repair and recombination protein rad54 protein [Rhizophagus irregularis DAOM 181602=DAOM 197198]